MASSEGAPTIAIQQVARARIEPGTAGLRVRRTYHSATLPPLFSIPVSWMSSRHLHIDLSSIPRNSLHCQWARKPPFIPKGFSSFQCDLVNHSFGFIVKTSALVYLSVIWLPDLELPFFTLVGSVTWPGTRNLQWDSFFHSHGFLASSPGIPFFISMDFSLRELLT